MREYLQLILTYVLPPVIYFGFLLLMLNLTKKEKISETTSEKFFKWTLLPTLAISFFANLYLIIFSFDVIKGILYTEHGITFNNNFVNAIQNSALYNELFCRGEGSIGYYVLALYVLLLVAVTASIFFYGKCIRKRTLIMYWLSFIIPVIPGMLLFHSLICTVFFVLVTIFSIKDIRNT